MSWPALHLTSRTNTSYSAEVAWQLASLPREMSGVIELLYEVSDSDGVEKGLGWDRRSDSHENKW